ncbi:EamA family transporter [Silvibacterium acidisoli]|uniref:EamA family transporter n=1 Tax=Acidobacteriaceae bacterium ZG23-2 TaxID=2883246 RepID=UPI00406C1C0A
MTKSTMTFRRYLVLGVVAVTAPLGDALLSAGMKHVGPVSLSHLGSLIVALRTPQILAGIAMLICFFSSYLASLSWADLTFVLPATSIGNVLIALLAHFWLGEYISPIRWLGILLITVGVGFVTRGPSYTEVEKKVPACAQAAAPVEEARIS